MLALGALAALAAATMPATAWGAVAVRWVVTGGPGRCSAYAVERNTGSGWAPASAWADSAARVPKVPRTDTGPFIDTLWVVTTQSGVPTYIRCRCLNAPGDSGAAYTAGVVPAGSLRADTTWYGWRGTSEETVGPALLGGHTRAIAYGSRDSLLIETLDAEQARRHSYHCRACGYGWWRGVRTTCP